MDDAYTPQKDLKLDPHPLRYVAHSLWRSQEGLE